MTAATPATAPALRRIVIGPLPPPAHGYAVAMQGLVRLLRAAGAEPEALDLAVRRRGFGYVALRLWRAAAAAARLAREGRVTGRRARVHIGVDGGAGIVLVMLVVLAARAAGCSLRLHHHSQARMHRRSLPLWLLARLAGRDALHVALRQPMAVALQARHGPRLQVQVLSNAAFVRPPAPSLLWRRGERERPLTVGMLGNLCAEKGLDAFLALADACRGPDAAQAPDARFLLAGPVVRARDLGAVWRRAAQGVIHWLGPVNERNRSSLFYLKVDLLVFPSRHVHEAEPFVLLEAMAHGCAIVAADVGYVRDLVGDAALVIRPGDDFVRGAMAAIGRARREPGWLRDMQAKARARFMAERAAALAAARAVLELEATTPLGAVACRRGDRTARQASRTERLAAEGARP